MTRCACRSGLRIALIAATAHLGFSLWPPAFEAVSACDAVPRARAILTLDPRFFDPLETTLAFALCALLAWGAIDFTVRRGTRTLFVVRLALVLPLGVAAASLLIELAQLWMPSRATTGLDPLAASLGAVAGALLRVARPRRPTPA